MATNILSVSNLAKTGREQPLFTGVTFGLNEGDKAALIGRNGTGKSTLLATIAGVLQPDDGMVALNREAGVSFLAQEPAFDPGHTIRDHVFRSASPALRVIRDYEEACTRLERADSPAAREHLDGLTQQMDAGNLWSYEAQVRSVLGVLGIHGMERTMGTLSGGMVKKVALAQVLVEDTALLLLDEPTNHLDIATIHWLQGYLAETRRTVLMVTHDRYFLDAVCTDIYELARNKVRLYQGNYSTYLEKKQAEAEVEANTERRIESVLRVERDWLLRGPCARGTKAKARIQHDMALINREKFRADEGFTFEVAGRRLGGKILELHHISKGYPKGFAHVAKEGGAASGKEGAAPVLRDFSYTFNKGEKIGVFGGNGSGKTTLLSIIAGELAPDTGSVVTGENTAVAYYRQNLTFADSSLSVLEYVQEAAELMRMNGGATLSAGQFLEQFGFTGKIQHSPVGTLSGGEKKRLFLVRLLLSNPNFLILDEPTNDFDIFTMNILEQFLAGFKGCLLIVSHDRYFMDKVADTLFIMEDDGSVSGYVGKCSEYLQFRELQKKEADARARAAAKAAPAPRTDDAAKPRKRSYKEQQELAALEAEIAALEARQKELEGLMAGSDYVKAAEAGTEYAQAGARLETAYARWEELA